MSGAEWRAQFIHAIFQLGGIEERYFGQHGFGEEGKKL
jgi:hypothetical protein